MEMVRSVIDNKFTYCSNVYDFNNIKDDIEND